ncbi:MAG TPA: hypothetical protein VED59_04040 [Acidimicrobiales bacterium]|nr:hypothetical protein [Acidimicrobiales bacterium]
MLCGSLNNPSGGVHVNGDVVNVLRLEIRGLARAGHGIISDGKDFPTCSGSQIEAKATDTVCPNGALVATGAIVGGLGTAASGTGAPDAVRPGARRLKRRAGRGCLLLRRGGRAPVQRHPRGRRPYSIASTAQEFKGDATQSATVRGTQRCS